MDIVLVLVPYDLFLSSPAYSHVCVNVSVPLMMAYVTRYIFGTDKLRPYAFEVRGLNGASTGVVHCDDAAILSQWLKYITDNIMGLTHLQVRHFIDYVLHIISRLTSVSVALSLEKRAKRP